MTYMPRIFAAIILIASSLQAGAVPSEASSGVNSRIAMEHDSAGELFALLLVTKNGDEVVKEWTSTPEAHAPSVRATDIAKRGDILTVMLFFSGCGSATEECGAKVDYQIYKPDGSIYADMPNNLVWANGPTKPRVIYLSPGMVKIRVETDDPLGEYTVIGTFRAPESGRPLKLQQKFTVTE